MRNFILLFTLILFSLFCEAGEKNTQLVVNIINYTEKMEIRLFPGEYNLISDSLNGKKAFLLEFDVNTPKYYSVYLTNFSFPIYCAPNDSIVINLVYENNSVNSVSSNNNLNEYLINCELIKNEFLNKEFNDFDSYRNELDKVIDTINYKISLLSGSQKNIDDIILSEKNYYTYFRLNTLMRYYKWNKFTENIKFNINDYDFSLNNIELYRTSGEYKTFYSLYTEFLVLKEMESMVKEDYYSKMFNIINNNVTEQEIKNSLLFAIMKSLLIKEANNLENFELLYSQFKDNCDDEKGLETIESLYNQIIGLKMGNDAPDFKLLNKDKQEVRLNDLNGDYIFLYVFAPKCQVCLSGLEKFKELSEKFHDILFVGISIDVEMCQWEKFIEDYSLKGIQLVAPENDYSFVHAYKAYYPPIGVLLDSNKKILNIRTPKIEKDLEEYLLKILAD